MRKYYKLQFVFKYLTSYLFKRTGVAIIILIFLITCMDSHAQSKLTDYVNPLIGTDGHGHTYPGASFPFGMVQLSPDTDTQGWDWCSGYHYSDNSIIGFSHTHLSGTGVGDYGDILLMPTTGELKTEPGSKEDPASGYRSRFSHKNEVAKAGYYSVYLDDYKIKAELTVTTRAGFHKYTFPKSENANIIIDLVHGIQNKTTDAEVKIIDNKIIEGYKRVTGWAKDRYVYFHAEFSKPFKSFGVVAKGKIEKGKSEGKGSEIKAFVEYSTSSGEVILVKVGISHTSLEGARKNLLSEIPGWNFDEVHKKAEEEWEKSLSSILVESQSSTKKIVFYTALYHALLNPNTFSDADGNYIGMDRKIHTEKNSVMYSVFSLWDTFRAEHPLFTIIDKKRASDMVKTLISKYDEYGLLPVWELASNETGTMIGYHSIPVIADAYFKGIRDFDVEKAFVAMKKSAMQDHLGLDSYKEMGCIPSNLESESVSKTLEYAYDDWCIAQMAKALGKEDDYKYFIERAKFYTNVFDPSTSLMRAKKNGRWFEPFDPYSVSGNYTEANAWQYSFFVPQDVNSLINLMGGDDKFISKLDELFTTSSELTGRIQSDITGQIGQYAQGNEPSHHMAYLYNYAGAPWKTQERIHEITSTLYTEKADGLCGNEDCGQMSAWYVFSAIGFYPVCPGDDKYIIGTPLFDKVTISTGEKKFTLVANNLSDKSFYIKSARLNGKEYPYSFIRHSDIINGGELVFEMSSEPGKWGNDPDARPKSIIDIPFVPVPYLTSGERVFKDSVIIAISTICGSSPSGLGPAGTEKIYFTTDGSSPVTNKNLYSSPIIIRNSAVLKTVCYKDGIYSKVVTANFNKIPEGRSIKIKYPYSHTYTGGGDLGLIDGIKGNLNFRTDSWQGYEGVDFEAVLDLGKMQKLSLINVSFLQNTYSWIFFPTLIEYYISTDGKNFTKVYETMNPADQKHSGESIKDFSKSLEGTEARFIKVFAKNVGVCPDWHVSAGGKAWIFVDEISVK
jgi:predicted alpha-1,2-mannosidase